MANGGDRLGTAERRKWSKQITAREKDLKDFFSAGDIIVDTYRIESKSSTQKDKYNILFSNTETIRPALYAQTPKVEVKKRQQDQENPIALAATAVLERALEYTVDEQPDDFDNVIGDAVLDLLLPGLGQVWPRYVPTFGDVTGQDGQPVIGEDGKPVQEVQYESIVFDYVNWKDFLYSKGRRWSEVWWVARRWYKTKDEVAKRFGEDIANKLVFPEGKTRSNDSGDSVEDGQVCGWEIWDKRSKTRIMFSENYPDDVLETESDPLGLEGFFPCPRPLRAIATNNKVEPRPYFAQYQAQADELNDVTSRIRRLVDALRVVGIYDASISSLQTLLTGTGNKMVPVEGWATVQDKGGLKGVVDFLPIQEVAATLMQLYDARDRVKGEIYEITGWSDIIRGVTKASETLGAQQLKSQWAGSRLKLMQKEVQRFIRDLLRIAGEIISEHYQDGTLALICGMEFERDSELRQVFNQVTQALKSDKMRCSLVTIETDSTLMPDEANDKQERMEFVGAAGAFLQQAVPAMQTAPALGPLLGEILMFAVRSFRSARPLEAKFQQFEKMLEQGQMGGGQQQGQEGQNGQQDAQAKAQTAVISAQQKAQSDQIKAGTAQAQLQQDAQQHAVDADLERQKEENRHAEKMAELALREREVAVKEAELGIRANTAENDAELRQQEFGLKAGTAATDADFRQQELNKPEKPQGGA